mmetsp:Transcript_23520/g.61881  ORF Transcript_23520/g.61881 Transcript_23520/m.61881 type:complete len:471 (-) Transcript_23520:74-1486(-)
MTHPLLRGVESDASLAILAYLHPVDVLRARGVSRQSVFYEVGADCLWWRTALERDFYVQDDSLRPKDHPPGAVPRVTYAAWHRAARELRLDPAGRAQRVPWRCVDLWRRMRLWASANAPWLVRTLRLGEMRHAAPWDAVCRELTTCGHSAQLVRGFWLVCNGQNTFRKHLACRAREGQAYSGLFGGYSAYDHTVMLHFLPIDQVRLATLKMRRSLPRLQETHPNCLVFASSAHGSKSMLVDVQDGMVYCTQGARHRWCLKPCVPATGERGEPFMRWVETLIDQLEQGVCQVAPIRPEQGVSTIGVNLFPQRGPLCSTVVTRGVEVQGSAVWILEKATRGWIYSIRFRLVGSAEERGFETCQLHRRHWILQEDGQEPRSVEGEGVVGLFPIMNDDGWLANEVSDPHGDYGQAGQQPAPFVYQSCSGQFPGGGQGTFGGEVTFVPGTMNAPCGEPFRVRVGPFPLTIPEVVI